MLVEERSRDRDARARTGAGGGLKRLLQLQCPRMTARVRASQLLLQCGLLLLDCGGVLGGRRFGLGVLQRRESHRADDSVAIRKLGWSCGPWRCCCADRRRRESVRAARGCAVQLRVHAARWALPCAKGRAEGVVRACPRPSGVGEPCRTKVGKFEGKCSGPSCVDKTKIGTLTMVDYDFFG